MCNGTCLIGWYFRLASVVLALQEWTMTKSEMPCIVSLHYDTGDPNIFDSRRIRLDLAAQSWIRAIALFCRLFLILRDSLPEDYGRSADVVDICTH